MRADVKLGVLFSAGIVMAAGGYYLWRSPGDAPIELSDSNKPDASLSNGIEPNANQATGQRRAFNQQTRSTPTRTNSPAKQTPNSHASRPAKRMPTARGVESQPAMNGRTPTVADAGDKRRSPAGSDPSVRRRPARTASDHASVPNRAEPSSMSDKTSTPSGLPSTSETGSMKVANGGPGAKGLPGVTARTDGASADRRAGNENLNNESTSTNRLNTERTLAARAVTPSPSPQDRAAVETHIVQPGDSLAGLSRRYYGTERYTDFLIKSNPQIANPSLLRIGATIRIPAPPDGRASNGARSGARRPGQAVGADRTYRVREGDSFYAIARDQLGNAARWTELFELNKSLVNGDPTSLRIGQEIKLPTK